MAERKKPYEKPQIITEETFETSALGCGKVDWMACGKINLSNS